MAHIHEKIDFTVHVFVVHGNRVLLRKHDKEHVWLGVGGHIELTEDPNQAAVREVKEEVGLDVELANDLLKYEVERPGYKELIPPKFMNRHSIGEHHEHIDLNYFARASSDVVVPGNPNDQWMWLTREDLEEKRKDLPRQEIFYYALQALKELST